MKKVNIIAGEVNSGKTSKLLEIYRQAGQGDGFINAKIYTGPQYAGQRIVWLSTGEVWTFPTEKTSYRITGMKNIAMMLTAFL